MGKKVFLFYNDKHEVIKEVPVYAGYGFTYIKFSDVPENLKTALEKFMYGQTGAVLNGENVIYSWDFERFMLGKEIID